MIPSLVGVLIKRVEWRKKEREQEEDPFPIVNVIIVIIIYSSYCAYITIVYSLHQIVDCVLNPFVPLFPIVSMEGNWTRMDARLADADLRAK